MSTSKSQVAIVTGANRGLGFQSCRELARLGYTVVLTSRDQEKGQKAAQELAKDGKVVALPLDVTNDSDVKSFAQHIEKEFGRVDVLVNNAGVFIDPKDVKAPLATPSAILEQTLETNLIGAYRMCQAFLPLMLKQGTGRIVNVSSGMGQLSEMGGGMPCYRISKTALNGLTRVLAAELGPIDILVNSICPGWVRTDMGGPQATRNLDEGARGIVWAATLPKGGPSGGYFRDGKPLSW